MEKTHAKAKIILLINRCENYFYKYLLYRESGYIDKFLATPHRVKHLIKKWNPNQ